MTLQAAIKKSLKTKCFLRPKGAEKWYKIAGQIGDRDFLDATDPDHAVGFIPVKRFNIDEIIREWETTPATK